MISAYNPSEQAYFRSAGFLGRSFDCYTPASEDGRANLMSRNITPDRMALLSSFDTIRRDIDTRGNMEAMDAYTQRAVQFVTSREFADALDITCEPLAVRNRYGIGFGTSSISRITLGLQNARFLMGQRAHLPIVRPPSTGRPQPSRCAPRQSRLGLAPPAGYNIATRFWNVVKQRRGLSLVKFSYS